MSSRPSRFPRATRSGRIPACGSRRTSPRSPCPTRGPSNSLLRFGNGWPANRSVARSGATAATELAHTAPAPTSGTIVMKYPKRVYLTEVGPRDGLQNEKQPVPTATKVELIRRLTEAGVRQFEATSFVSPRWVPQMADAAEVMAAIERPAGSRVSVLAPNVRGLE